MQLFPLLTGRDILGMRHTVAQIEYGSAHDLLAVLLFHEAQAVLEDPQVVLTAQDVVEITLRLVAEILQHLLAEIVRRQHERPRGLHKPRAQPHMAVVVLHA